MKSLMILSLILAMSLGALSFLTGCEATGAHQMRSSPDGHVMACKLCYDEAVAVTRASSKGHQWDQYQVIKKHRCPECKQEMTVYTKDGTPMIKCQKCAPEGVPCDKCLPPKTAS